MGSFCLNSTSKVILYSKTPENSNSIVVISDAIEFDYDSNINCNITSSSEFNNVWTMRLESDGRIKLNLGSSRKVNLKVYSINGSKVYEIEKNLSAGYNEIKLDLKNGIYIIKFEDKVYKWLIRK
jgi:hypothetical protein